MRRRALMYLKIRFLAQMRKASVAKISLLIFMTEPSIWRLRQPRAKILQFLRALFFKQKNFFGYILDTDREYILGNDALGSEANHDYNSNEKKDSLRFDDYSLLLDHCMRRFRNICKRRDRNSIHCRFIFCYNFSIQ